MRKPNYPTSQEFCELFACEVILDPVEETQVTYRFRDGGDRLDLTLDWLRDDFSIHWLKGQSSFFLFFDRVSLVKLDSGKMLIEFEAKNARGKVSIFPSFAVEFFRLIDCEKGRVST